MTTVEIDSKVLVAGAVGLVTLMAIFFFMLANKTDSKAAAKAAANKKKKQKKKAAKVNGTAATSTTTSSTTTSRAAPVPEPEPAPEETANKKKKKKKKAKAPEPEPEPQPEPEPEPEPVKVTKKKKKKKKKNGAAASGEAAPGGKTATGDVDSDEEDDVAQAARLLALQKNSKPKNNNNNSSSSDWTSVPVKRDNGKSSKATTITDADKKPEIMLNIGRNPTLIIGPGGSIIQNITTTSGAKLDILKNTPNPGENMVRITADNQDAIALAMEMVQKIVDEEEKRLANSKTVTLTSSDINGSDGVKAIIGRKGETIKDIQSKCTGVKLDADVDKGQVVVSGPKDMVDKAVKLCKIAVFGEAQSTLPLKSRSAVNIVFGKDFATIRQIQDSSGAKLDVDKETNVLKLSGKAEQVAAAKQAVTALLQRCQGIAMDVKAADIGAVYGKSGANIRNIQDKTGAFVEVNQPSPGADAKCSVMGEPAAVEEAKKLIEKAIAREVELKPGEVAETVQLAEGASAVIGKGGSKIKELERKHTVQLNVNGDTGVCQIVGKAKNVTAARTDIEGIIKPIIAGLEAERKAAEAAQSGDSSAWQGHENSDADGW